MLYHSRPHFLLLTIALFVLSYSTQAQTATHKTPFDFDGDNRALSMETVRP